MIRYLDVCAGISASTVAWKPLGWVGAAYSEIEAAPRAILAHHYPDTPLHGDFTTIRGDEYGAIDLLVGGTPCQDFSVAGLRAGLDGDRGNLSLEFLRLADRARPRWVVWENVPGVLSIDGGRAFGAILGGLGELGYGFAYRVLDAQHFGVPQRRRRVFVVGCVGDHRCAGAVLFERHSLSGHPAPRREAGQVAPTIPSRSLGGGGLGTDFDCDGGLIQAFGGNNCSDPVNVAAVLQAHAGPAGRMDFATETFVTQPIPTCYDTTHITSPGNWSNPRPGDPCHPLTATAHVPLLAPSPIAFDCTAGGDTGFAIGDIAGALRVGGRSTGHASVAFTSKDHGQDVGDMSPTLRDMQGSHANAGGQVAVAYGISGDAIDRSGEGDGSAAQRAGLGISTNVATTLRTHGRDSVCTTSVVRRLTPRECERLQGFPDDYTLVPHRGKPMADGPRYKALGNSMAVPVMRWIGERIAAVDALPSAGAGDAAVRAA